MHTKASNSVINAAKQMKLEVVLAKGAAIVHPVTAHELLSHLIQIHRCNASDNPLQVVAIDMEFNVNRITGGNRRPILRLIGLCYADDAGHKIMVSVDMKVVDRMNESDMKQVKVKLCDLFVTGRGRMVAFDFKQDEKAL
jgi:hypothetical protein